MKMINGLNGSFLFENSQLIQVENFKESDIEFKRGQQRGDELEVTVLPLIDTSTEEQINALFSDEYRGFERIKVRQCSDKRFPQYKEAEFIFKQHRDVAVWVQELESGVSP